MWSTHSKRLLLTALLSLIVLGTLHSKEVVTLSVKVKGKDSTLLSSVVVLLEPYGVWGVTGDNGIATLKQVPYDSNVDYRLSVSLLGYKKEIFPIKIKKGIINYINVILEEESLLMSEVVVVAKSNKSGESTTSKIGRQALEHLQATSLRDVLQLLPGNVAMYNPGLNVAQHFQLRSLNTGSYNSFGSTVMVDGVPISTNASMGVSNTLSEDSGGVDLRGIGVEDVESIEIIRGIASAEYGDLSGGAMIISSKIGITDFSVKGKIMPGITQLSLSKGFEVAKRKTLNISFDYAHGKSDPRFITDTYDRITGNAIYSFSLFDNKWLITNKLSLTGIYEWDGADPEEPAALQEFYRKRDELNIVLTHSGSINLNKLFSRVIKYDISYTNNHNNAYVYAHKNVGGGPFLNSNREGTYENPMIFPNSYSVKGGTRSIPITYFAKISNMFYLNKGGFKNRFNMGAEFRSEGNEGIGRYDLTDFFSDIVTERLKPFNEYPYLTQLSAYIEDNMELNLTEKPYPNIKAQIGFRWSMVQPGKKEQLQSFSPRINASLNATKWLSLRFGYGLSEKTPSLKYLYPDPFYYDFYNINVSNSAGDRFIVYTTRIFDPTNLALKPMRNIKYEAGFDLNLNNGMNFSVIGYSEEIKNGFGSTNNEWVALKFSTWSGTDVWFENGYGKYNSFKPTNADSVILCNISRPGNTGYQKTKGVEFDFDLGKIKTTNTSFYLNGAYINTIYRSENKQYSGPGKRSISNVYVVYPVSSMATKDVKRFSSALRIVQHIPSLRFIVSATAQFVFYDYDRTLYASEYPIGYIKASNDWRDKTASTIYVPFTQEQLNQAVKETVDTPAKDWVKFEGYRLKNEILTNIVTNLPRIWPTIWCVNIRVTKEISNLLGFSFYLNNLLFYQPWQTSTLSSTPVERNSSLFSYGLEMSLKF